MRTNSSRAWERGIQRQVPSFYFTEAAVGEDPDKRNYIVSNARMEATGFQPKFSLDAGIGRTFTWGARLNLDWRLNASNVLNRVTYRMVNTIVGSPQFGLPTLANPMRKVQSSLRVRF